MTPNLNPTWNLDVFFPGGSNSNVFFDYLSELEQDIADFQAEAGALNDGDDISGLVRAVDKMQDIARRQRQAGAFVSCLKAQDTKDEGAQLLSGRIQKNSAQISAGLNAFDHRLLSLSDDAFEAFLRADTVAPVRFAMAERRQRAKEKLGVLEETLISDLSVDGYNGWGNFYDLLVGRIQIPWEEQGALRMLSAGQAANVLTSRDEDTRHKMGDLWEKAWADQAELFSGTLNHLAGFRLSVYKHRGWDSVLREPLEINRMSEDTLQTMWQTIEANKAPFVAVLNRKAALLGRKQLGWHDVTAPVGSVEKRFTYEEARDFIVKHFARFSADLSAFASRCFEERWIEVEDRANKQPGGFCTSFPVSGQSRIFMTFSGTPGNVATLAHELGHAYHQHVMQGLPQFATNYAMNVAETASTFAEMIVADAAVEEAASNEERVALLDDKLERAIAFFMNIHARFLFETRFYEARKQGLVRVSELNRLMVEAQKEAFCDALADYHPHFWASKLHFHITGTPFYNFPYTFGYLFSSGIYHQAKQAGPDFAVRYVDLLRDTASMRVEELAEKHLGVDLTKPDFWQVGIDMAIQDANAWLQLTEPSVTKC